MFKLRPSAAKQWMECPASFTAQRALPPEKESGAAAYEGTAAHALAQICLNTGKKAIDFPRLLVEGKHYDFPEDSMRYVQDYCDHITEIQKGNGPEAKLLVEQKVSVPSAYLAKDVILEGTLDAAITADDKLYVADLKFGRGVEVISKANPQIMIYALAMLERLEPFDQVSNDARKIKNIVMIIYQPRIQGAPFSNFKMTADDLRAWGQDELSRSVARVKRTKPKFVPGVDQCRFCRYRDQCDAFATEMTSTIGLVIKPLATMTNAEKVKIFRASSSIKKMLDAVEYSLLTEMHNGEVVEGVKMVSKVQHRKWGDVKALERDYGDRVFNKVLMTPAAAAKVIGHEAVDKYLLKQKPIYKVSVEESKAREHQPAPTAAVFASLKSD